MELKEAIFDVHRITEEIRNYVRKDELPNLWNCIIENIEQLRNALDVICKHYPEDRWILTSEKMPKPNELVWVCDKHHRVCVCQLLDGRDDWFDSNDEWLFFRDSVIAWHPYLIPEPYEEPEEVVEDIWHPVSEDPPKKLCNYLVQIHNLDDEYVGVSECKWTNANLISSRYTSDWHWVGNPQYTKIVAWRPLPERFIGDEDGSR